MIPVTRWASLRAPVGDAAEVSWEQLGEWLATPRARTPKPQLPGWAPTRFKDNHRSKDAVVEVGAVVLDVDSGDHGADALYGALPWRAYVHSSASWTPQHPKWRIIVAVDRPILPGEYDDVWKVVRDEMAAHGVALDEQTKDPSRLWFVPCELADGEEYIAGEREGEPLAVDEVVERAAIAENKKANGLNGHVANGAVSHETEPPELARISVSKREKRAREWLSRADIAVQGEVGSNEAIRVASVIVRGFALPTAQAITLLREWSQRCDPPWSEAELIHKERDARRPGRRAWGEKLLEPPKPGAAKSDTEKLLGTLPKPKPAIDPETIDPKHPLAKLDRLRAVSVIGRDQILALAAKPIVYLWDDIVVGGTVVVLAGSPSCGKTTLLFLILVARAHRGEPKMLLDHKVTPAIDGYIVLIEGEHSDTSASRKLLRSCRILGVDPYVALDRIILIARKSVRIASPEWVEIETLVAAGIVTDIAIDTLARVAPADANDEREQVAIFDRIAQAIEHAPTQETRPVVWVAAHTRKGESAELDDLAGSAQRAGQSDTVIILRAERRDGRVVTTRAVFHKLREDPEMHPSPVEYSIVQDRISGMAMNPEDAEPLEKRIIRFLRLGPATKTKLAERTGRSRTDVDAALTALFNARAVRTASVTVNGRHFKAFELADAPPEESLYD